MTWRRRPPLLLLSGVLVGGLGFLNTWDLPTFGFLWRCWCLRATWSVARPRAQALTRHGWASSLPLSVLAVAALHAVLPQLLQPGQRPRGGDATARRDRCTARCSGRRWWRSACRCRCSCSPRWRRPRGRGVLCARRRCRCWAAAALGAAASLVDHGGRPRRRDHAPAAGTG